MPSRALSIRINPLPTRTSGRDGKSRIWTMICTDPSGYNVTGVPSLSGPPAKIEQVALSGVSPRYTKALRIAASSGVTFARRRRHVDQSAVHLREQRHAQSFTNFSLTLA